LTARDTRERLLDAAVAVTRRDGAQSLTLDAVAAQAGVSKGGVLYHFATKRALIDGLISRWLDDFAAQLEGESFAVAYVRACDIATADTEAEVGLLAGMLEEPEVLEVARERYAEWMDRILADVRDPADAWLLRLAADGLWYSDLLGIAAPQGADRRRLIDRLVALAQGGSR
jgi:AcrR family transcriptional regulator